MSGHDGRLVTEGFPLRDWEMSGFGLLCEFGDYQVGLCSGLDIRPDDARHILTDAVHVEIQLGTQL